ncbi:hypothetical protein NEOLEDRAFT_1128318 [Neolentinus lepideus HHB14362 ss-1]|uniref:Uncharacterized protein n=1 Tax=Neolentinus lepideus HHB14362 ss-1 TaxID=1314782 RepID=A0A165VE34_9AGAM|nr:hypothetical protein NEOLEDRAFT_1128318 [Neolentinus lepideus HHB14362 ss-1]
MTILIPGSCTLLQNTLTEMSGGFQRLTPSIIEKRDARIEPQGLLLPIELDTLHSSISPDEDTEQGLHILCSLQRSCCLRTTAFWMTRSSLIDAISGEQSANQLNIRKTFHRCLCSPAWSPAVSEVSEEGQGSAYRSIYELKPLRSYPRAYQ